MWAATGKAVGEVVNGTLSPAHAPELIAQAAVELAKKLTGWASFHSAPAVVQKNGSLRKKWCKLMSSFTCSWHRRNGLQHRGGWQTGITIIRRHTNCSGRNRGDRTRPGRHRHRWATQCHGGTRLVRPPSAAWARSLNAQNASQTARPILSHTRPLNEQKEHRAEQ